MPKRTYDIIACSDCGGPAKAPNRATKYCATCRLGRGAQWHNGKPSTCGCGRKYIAWNGFKATPRCGRCFLAVAPEGGREAMRGECATCHSVDVPLFSEHIRLCYTCLDEPSNFKGLKPLIIAKWNQLKGTP